MEQIEYYFAYKCLEELVNRKKITPNVANKILKEYEEKALPIFTHSFK